MGPSFMPPIHFWRYSQKKSNHILACSALLELSGQRLVCKSETLLYPQKVAKKNTDKVHTLQMHGTKSTNGLELNCLKNCKEIYTFFAK